MFQMTNIRRRSRDLVTLKLYMKSDKLKKNSKINSGGSHRLYIGI
jgi:hypothetical protein